MEEGAGAQRRAPRLDAGAQGEGVQRGSRHIDSRRRWRLAATVLSATACAAAVLSFVAVGDSGERAEVLISTEQRSELKAATALKRVHRAYDRAKGRLERMSTEYTDLGVKLQAAESRASALRTELESKMRQIRSDFKRDGGTELSEQHTHRGSTMSLAEMPSSMERGGSLRLQHEVEELKDRMKRVDAREAKQAEELRQLRQQAPAVAKEEDADVGRFPRRPMLGFRAERTMSPEHVAAFAHLQSVNMQLQYENRKICELCAHSAVLRANRQQTCSICSQYEHAPGEIEGGTDLATQGLANEAINVFVSGWKQPQQQQQHQSLLGGVGGMGGLMNVGDIVARAAQISAANNGGVETKWGQVAKQQLVQIDDGDHMGTSDGPSVTAFITEGSEKFVVGKCAPSADELKFSAWESICTMCKGKLGIDIEALGHTVQCSHD